MHLRTFSFWVQSFSIHMDVDLGREVESSLANASSSQQIRTQVGISRRAARELGTTQDRRDPTEEKETGDHV